MFGYQKIKRKDFSWKWIFLFLLFMWIMTFVCRFISENGIPTVEVCRVEKNFVGESDVRYSLCVPLEAVHTDENGNQFVYCLEEQDSILGIVTVAERRYVNVIIQDESIAALEEGTITIADEIIAHSNMELENGSKVKLD